MSKIHKITTLAHIHDKCCGHAINTIEKIVESALNDSFTEIYLTEHLPYHGNKKRFVRPSYEELKTLIDKIEAYNIKYSGKLKIYFGYEAEYNKTDKEVVDKILEDGLCHYAIFGNHFYGSIQNSNFVATMYDTHAKEQVKKFVEDTEFAMKQKKFSWAAHPDIWLNSYKCWDETAINATRKLAELSIKYDCPLGFNLNYSFKCAKPEFRYPVEYFWKEIAKTPAKVVIENDSHDPSTIRREWVDKNQKIALEWGLEKNITYKIPIIWFKNQQNNIC